MYSENKAAWVSKSIAFVIQTITAWKVDKIKLSRDLLNDDPDAQQLLNELTVAQKASNYQAESEEGGVAAE
jgi:hypothetical protein